MEPRPADIHSPDNFSPFRTNGGREAGREAGREGRAREYRGGEEDDEVVSPGFVQGIKRVQFICQVNDTVGCRALVEGGELRGLLLRGLREYKRTEGGNRGLKEEA